MCARETGLRIGALRFRHTSYLDSRYEKMNLFYVSAAKLNKKKATQSFRDVNPFSRATFQLVNCGRHIPVYICRVRSVIGEIHEKCVDMTMSVAYMFADNVNYWKIHADSDTWLSTDSCHFSNNVQTVCSI